MKNNIELQRPFLRAAKKILVTIALVATVAYAANAQTTNTFPNSGNAGIGTTTPTAPLEINKNQNAGTNVVVDNGYTTAGNAAYSGFWFRQNAANRFFVGSNNDGNTTQNGGAGAVQFWNFINAPVLFATNNTERLRISGTGLVGIGTSAPNVRLGQKLDIAASGDYSGAVFSTWSSLSAASLLDLNRSKSNTIGTHSAVANNDLLGVLSGRGSDGANFLTASQVQFWVDGSVTSNIVPGRIVMSVVDTSGSVIDAMTIKSSGNVGIGTTNPDKKLVVVDGSSLYLKFLRSSNDGIYMYSDGALYGLNAYDFTNQVYKPMSIGWGQQNVYLARDGGTVGINKTDPNPAYKLDVNGEINATGLRINGTPISTGVNSQWSGTSGNPIYYTSGNVGIGTSGPVYSLDVNGGVNSFRAKAATTSSSDVIATFENGSGIQAIVRGNGNVGIGTTSPSAKLEVASNSAIKLGNAYFSSGGDFVHLANNEWYNGSSWTATAPGALIQISGQDVNFYRHDAAGSHTSSLNINSSGNVGIGTPATASGAGNLNVLGTIEAGNIKAKYQDVAEWVPSSEQLVAATVVVLDTTKSNQVIASAVAYDTRVAGVISAQPGITLGEGGEGKVLVATTGRVRVKVDASRGAIQIGDLLVTSDVAGVAMKSEPVEFAGRKMHMPGTIIGKALEPLAKGKGEILVLLSLQ